MSSVLEMEGYTFNVEGGEVKVLVRNKKSEKEIWRAVPEQGPVWKRVMAKADPEAVQVKAEAETDPTTDAPGTQPEDQPEAEVNPVTTLNESKTARKRRLRLERQAKLKAEREAAEAKVLAE